MDEKQIRQIEIDVAMFAFGFRWYVIPFQRGPLRMLWTPELMGQYCPTATLWDGAESVPVPCDYDREVPRYARDSAGILEAFLWLLKTPRVCFMSDFILDYDDDMKRWYMQFLAELNPDQTGGMCPLEDDADHEGVLPKGHHESDVVAFGLAVCAAILALKPKETDPTK